MLTVPQLVAADPEELGQAATAWHTLARTVGTQAAALDREVVALRRAWHGDAADAATVLLSRLCTELDAATPSLYAVAGAVTEHAATVARAQDIAVAARSTGARVTVAPDGTATLDRTGDKPDPGDVVAAEAITGQLYLALALAGRSDADTAARLAGLGPGPATDGSTPAGPPDLDPRDISGWWAALDPARRRALIDDRPELVGSLDGIPAADRDAANRTVLDRLLADPGTPHRAGLLALRTRLDGPGPVYLLDISAAGVGRAIVAIGDPDTADNVVTSVPGLGGRLDHVADELARIGNLSDATRSAAPEASTSVIAWLGYDAPDSLLGAARRSPAVAAEQALHRFQQGLRVTHRDARAHATVVGLSYGSTVVGLTGHAKGLDADDVVLIGSPGVGVAHATDLGLDPAHVWASTARHDAINAAADPLRPGIPPPLRPILGVPADRLWFGPSPSGAGFGAHVFASAPGSPTDPLAAHTAYFDPGNPALTTMAHIAVS